MQEVSLPLSLPLDIKFDHPLADEDRILNRTTSSNTCLLNSPSSTARTSESNSTHLADDQNLNQYMTSCWEGWVEKKSTPTYGKRYMRLDGSLLFCTRSSKRQENAPYIYLGPATTVTCVDKHQLTIKTETRVWKLRFPDEQQRNSCAARCLESKELDAFMQPYTIDHVVKSTQEGVHFYVHRRDSGRALQLELLYTPDRTSQDRIRSRIRRQIKVSRCLRNGGVLCIEEHLQLSRHVLAVKACGGLTLEDYSLQNAHLTLKPIVSEKKAFGLIRQLVQSLLELKDGGYVHLNITPQSIVLGEERPLTNLYLTMGCSTKWSLQTSCFRTDGTLGWSAPEVLSECHNSGAVADVFSLGVLLYHLLMGCSPFPEDLSMNDFQSNTDVLKQVIRATYTDNISFVAQDLLLNMLTIDPKERITLEGIRHHNWWRQNTAALTQLSL